VSAVGGGHNWQATTFSVQTGCITSPLWRVQTTTRITRSSREGLLYTGARESSALEPTSGAVVAMDPGSGGQVEV